MKKLLMTFLIYFVITINTLSFGITEEFKTTLEVINVPETNANGYLINEEMYNKYNLIVYGKPQDVIKNQRWKDTPNGKSINPETGKKGEYRILGYSLSGSVVNNEAFPDDYVGGVSPEDWAYIYIDDALSSWNDTSKYQTLEQIDYMLNTKLSRNGTTYNLTAKDIGLDKARIESFATWKTAGSIFTLKKDANGILWGATFNVPPMAENVDIKANLNFQNGLNYIFEEDTDFIEIPFSYGADAFNLNSFTQESHIKSLSSTIYIQNSKTEETSKSRELSISKDSALIINKSDFENSNQIEIRVKNVSILETFFNGDAPLIDIVEETLVIQNGSDGIYIDVRDVNRSNDNEIPRPIISDIRLYRKTLNEDIDLFTAKKTSSKFICAGEILVVKAKVLNAPDTVTFNIEGDLAIRTMDKVTKKFLVDEAKNRGTKSPYSKLTNLEKEYKLPRKMNLTGGYYEITYLIPYGTKQTLHSWSTLRMESRDALNIDTKNLFTRIKPSFILKIKASNDGGTTTKSVPLDVFERWDTIYNRDISEYVK